jgi:N-acetylneuraminic acid mutarotase
MTAADGQLFLFGGSGPSLGASNGYGYLGDTWTWNGATWTELFEMAPRPRSGQVMATLGSTMMIFGGSVHNTGQPGIGVCSVDSDSCTLDDTYTWDGISSAGWTMQDPTTSPEAQSGEPVSVLGSVVVLVGYYGDTWAWDGTTWAQQAASGPPPRGGAAMATLVP